MVTNIEAIKQRLYGSGLHIRLATMEDAPILFELYRSVAKSDPNVLTAQYDEITLPMVQEEIGLCSLYGATLIAEKDNVAIGVCSARTSHLRRYAHIFTNIRLFVLSQQRNFAGVGFLLAHYFCEKMDNSMPHIAFVQINPYKHNVSAINLYHKLGFTIQVDELKDTVFLQTADSDMVPHFSSQVIMTRKNPNFDYQALLKYHQYLKEISDQLSYKYAA